MCLICFGAHISRSRSAAPASQRLSGPACVTVARRANTRTPATHSAVAFAQEHTPIGSTRGLARALEPSAFAHSLFTLRHELCYHSKSLQFICVCLRSSAHCRLHSHFAFGRLSFFYLRVMVYLIDLIVHDTRFETNSINNRSRFTAARRAFVSHVKALLFHRRGEQRANNFQSAIKSEGQITREGRRAGTAAAAADGRDARTSEEEWKSQTKNGEKNRLICLRAIHFRFYISFHFAVDIAPVVRTVALPKCERENRATTSEKEQKMLATRAD